MLPLQTPDAGGREAKETTSWKEVLVCLNTGTEDSSASTGAVLQPSPSPTANERTDRHLMNLILTCVE